MSFMKKNAGFTLVELIVVIAILGILAGVAIPTYSGYIEKAQIAGDQQELHNLNLAYAAACAEAGESNFNRNGVSVTTSGSAGSLKVTGVVDSEEIVANFQLYYPQADAGVFKYATQLYYSGTEGGFKMNEGGMRNETGYRKEYTDAVDTFNSEDNSYHGNEVALLGTVNQFTGAFSGFLGSNPNRVDSLLEDPDFKKFCEDNGIPMDSYDAIGGAMAMYAAEVLSDVNPSAIYNAVLNSYDAQDGLTLDKMGAIMNGGEETKADLALNGAVLAAVIAGYANSEYATEDARNYFNTETGTVNSVGTLDTYLNGIVNAGKTDEGDSFAKYLQEQGAADIEAFTAGLAAVNAGNEDVINTMLSGGDYNSVLLDLLGGTWTPSGN